MKVFRLAPLAAISTLAFGVGAQAQQLPEGPGKAVVQTACVQCHGVDVITRQPRSRDEWIEVVASMIGRGAQLSDDEYSQVIDYLSTQLGPAGQKAPVQGHPPAPPPPAKRDR